MHGVMASSEPRPVGAIFDTNSQGRFDLVVYDDGLLAIKGTYVRAALRGAGAATAGTGLPGGFATGGTYEAKRLARVLESERAALVMKPPNFFISRDAIVGLVLRRRWYRHSLSVLTHESAAERRFDWKPMLNNFAQVQELLASTFPSV
jgi:hypothetical protein